MLRAIRRAFVKRPMFVIAVVYIAAVFAVFEAWPELLEGRRYAGVKDGDVVELTGTVAAVSASGEYTMYTLADVKTAGGEEFNGVFFRSGTKGYRPGDVIEAQCSVYYPDPARYRNAFDDLRYCASRGIDIRAYSIFDRRTEQVSAGAAGWFWDISQAVGSALDGAFREQAPIARALLMGDTDEMSESSLEAFRTTGVAHVLATSGLHVGFVLMGITALLKPLRLGRRVSAGLVIAALVFYAGIAGFRISIMRAVVMASIHQLAGAMGRRADGLNTLCTALLAITVWRPAQVYDIGLQLSFSTVFAIMCLARPLEGLLKWLPGRVRSSVGMSAAATIGSAPIVINTFHYFPPFSVLLNLVVIPLAALVTLGSGVTAILYMLWPTLGACAAMPFRYAIAVMERLAELSAGLPFASLEAASLGAGAAAAVLICCYVISGASAMRALPKVILCGGILLVWGTVHMVGLIPPKQVTAESWLSGSESVLVRSPSGGSVLVDTGELGGDAAGFVRNNGVTLSAVVLRGAEDESTGGLAMLLDEGRVSKVLAPSAYEAYLELAFPPDIYGDNVIAGFAAGDVIALEDGTEVRVLSDDRIELAIGYEDHSVLIGPITAEEEP